jgi:hypothetical protein
VSNYAYNPITGQLDLVGGGASYIDGVVADSSLLPVTLGTPALDSVFLAKAGSGLWLISRRPAGLYVRVANNGVAADWTYLGSFPEVNADANWELYNSTDPTKELKFDLSGLPTSTVRTVGAPAGNGQMMVSGQAGSFTTLTANNGTLTASAPVLSLSQTWNNAAVTFTGANIDITNTASATGSRFLDCMVGGASAIRLARIGSNPYALFGTADTGIGAISTSQASIIANGGVALVVNSGGNGVYVRSDSAYAWASGTNLVGATTDLILRRDAANTLALQNAANAQTFRIYNTFTDANNHERGFLRWSSNVFQIGTEKGSGGGTARDLDFQSDGSTRMRIPVSGTIRVLNSLTNYAGSITGSPTIGISTFGYLSGTAGNSGGLLFYNGNGGGVGARLGTEEDFVLAMRNAGNSHSLRIYNTHTSTTSWERLNLRWASNEFILDAEAGSGGGTLRGIKIGSATSSLLGFYGAPPVDRPATVADPAGGGTIDTEARTAINDIIDRLQELGLIA